MCPLKRLGIFLPADTNIYRSLFRSLQRAFAPLDIEIAGTTSLLSEKDLLEFVSRFKPCAIFEMNRSRRQIPSLPKAVKHIAWMVDVADWPYEQIGESEIIYFFGTNWLANFPEKHSSLVRWLPPAADPIDYSFSRRKRRCDISFIGHIPAPWSEKERNRIVYCDNKTCLTFDTLFHRCQQHWKQIHLKGFDNEAYLHSAITLARELTGATVTINEQKLRYDISCRSVRVIQRKKMLDAALQTNAIVHIYGSPNWKQYPEYSTNYKKYLNTPAEMQKVYQTSHFNLHEGVGLHFRTFDCLMSGGLLLYLQGPDDHSYGGMQTFLEPYTHYIPCTAETLATVVKTYRNDHGRCDAIRAQASQHIAQNHTWQHRARQIVEDFALC